jgi:hypothetical protein
VTRKLQWINQLDTVLNRLWGDLVPTHSKLVDFTVEKIVLFIAYLFEEGKSSNTISTYLEALSYYLKFKGKPDITNNFIINKLVNGDKRLAF